MKTSFGPALGVVLLGVFGCSSSDEGDQGTPIQMVGAFSATGVSAVASWPDALKLAARHANEGLAAADYPTNKRLNFKSDKFDTRNDQAITVERSIEWVQELGAKMIINGTSSDTVALSELAYDDDPSNDIDVPIICVACSSPSLHNPEAVNADATVQAANRNSKGWVFGLAMSSVPQSRVLWNILTDNTPDGNIPGDLNGDNKVKISTIALNDPFGTGFQNAMQKVLTDLGVDANYEKIRHRKDADPDQYDWAAALALLTDQKTEEDPDGTSPINLDLATPDVIIEFTFPNFSLALAKAYTGTIPFFHTHSMREQPVIDSAGGKLNGQEGTSYLPSDGASGADFDEAFAAEYPNAPRQSQWDSGIYDGGILFALATIAATKDMNDPSEATGEQIKTELMKLNDKVNGVPIGVGPTEFAKAAKLIADGKTIDYQGASGPCDFDEYGRALNRISHWKVSSGKVSDVAVYDCVQDPNTCPKLE